MDNTVKILNDFVSAAERSRKYPANTASGLRTALRLFEGVLTDEEKGSVEVFRDRLPQIYQEVFNRNSTKYSAGSLNTYKIRIDHLLKDFFKYGKDAAAMAAWAPKVIIRKQRKSISPISSQPAVIQDVADTVMPTPTSEVHRFEIHLPSGGRAMLIVPSNLSADDAKKIKSFVDAASN